MKSDCAFLRKQKADSLRDELCSSFFDSLTFCRWRAHTLPMASFHATIPSLSIHFAGYLAFSQKLNMPFQDFHNIQSVHNVTAEFFNYGLFWKLSKKFDFHRNQCKKRILYGYATNS